MLKNRCCSVLLAMLFTSGSGAYASSSFSGSANLAFAFSGNMDGVNIVHSGSYSVDGSDTYGYASFSQELTFPSPASGSFSAVGDVGYSDLYQDPISENIAQFSFGLENKSGQSKQFSLSLDYILHAVASGEFAYSLVQLEFGDTDYDAAEAYVSGFFQDEGDVTVEGAFDPYQFNLASGEKANFDVIVGVTGNIAGTTPVPLPGAVWPFLAGLIGLLGLNKKSKIAKV